MRILPPYGLNTFKEQSAYWYRKHEQDPAALRDALLHRGNLQKATFVGPDGKEEKLYISPNITFGSLNVYDQNKQRMPTETLVDKQFIGKELGEQLIQRVKEQQQTQKTPELPQQKQTPAETPKQELKKTQTVKQKAETPVKKQRHKQKLQ